jgi:diacylglycerol kinase (ATP)
MDDARPDPCPLLFFINPSSGGGLASDLIHRIENEPLIFIVRLPAEVANWSETHAELLQSPNVRLVACGGDGTVNWVVSLLNVLHGGPNDQDGRPPLSVIPFGTGNDLSRALGWGPYMDTAGLHRIRERVRHIRQTPAIANLDVWQVTVTRTDTNETTTSQMLNYFSIGVDAEIALDFEHCRKGACGACICCPCMSKTCYVPVGMSNACCKRSLTSYCQIEVHEITAEGEVVRNLVPLSKDKTVIFQAIPSMYGGKDPWKSPIPRAMDDRKVEVTFQGGATSLGLFQIGCNTGRNSCQVSQATLELTEPFHIQVDGEGKVINGPARVEFARVGSYPMLLHREE